mgnify:CR=1 FL=1
MKTSRPIFSTIAILAIASLILLSFTYDSSITAKDQMILDWERARLFSEEYLNAATDEVIVSKPTPEMRSFGEQMLHLTEANYSIGSVAGGKTAPYTFGQLEKNADQYKTKTALTKAVLDSYDFVIGALKETDEAKMNEMVKLFNFEMTREQAFQKAFEHQTHHRGQTTVYLRLKGVKPPQERLF